MLNNIDSNEIHQIVYTPRGTRILKMNFDDYNQIRGKIGIPYDRGGYPVGGLKNGDGTPIHLARVIMDFYDMSMVVDHKNHDRYDCRRENLRIATRQQNAWNRGKPPLYRPTISKYIGVSPAPNGKWKAVITHNNQVIKLGVFDTEEEAALAYNAKAEELRGEWAVLNEVC